MIRYQVRVREFANWVPDFASLDNISQHDYESEASGNDQDIHSINESQEEGEINDKKEQMGYEMNAPGKSDGPFEEGEIIGESNDGCVKDCMGKKLDDDVEKDIEDCSNNVTEKCGVVNNNMSNNVEGEILEDHFDGDRGNDTIEDNADVNPSTNVSLEVNIPEVANDSINCVTHLRPRILRFSYLIFFYADDVVFIGQWSDSNIFTIIHVLDCFFGASGLRINLHKSKLIGIVVDPSSVEAAANDIGCMALNLSFSYLGINIGGHMSRIKAWDNVINKVLCRLSKWKMKSLSIGGRLTLLKSILGSTPIYYMSMFKAPIHVLKKIESIRSHFFNGVDPNVQKMTFVKWDNVLASKEKGGLGLLKLSMAMMAGNGERTLFWEESWKGEVPLKNLFPKICTLETDKSISVASKMAHSSLCFSLRRTLRGGIEQVQMEDLKSYLEGTILSSMLGRWRWSFSGDGEFSVSSVRSLIDDKILEVVGPKTRWIKYVPIKDTILAWRIKLAYLPTRLNLSRRGIDLESIFCTFCNSAVESSSHIFFACSMVKDLYKNIARWWDVNMTELYSYEKWWNWFSNLCFPSKLEMIFE
ncbi:RNA-directed DNA polymerase, eukaryota, reverse transcriptase zinc-binding domain protein [Tanacetum coccineum]